MKSPRIAAINGEGEPSCQSSSVCRLGCSHVKKLRVLRGGLIIYLVRVDNDHRVKLQSLRHEDWENRNTALVLLLPRCDQIHRQVLGKQPLVELQAPGLRPRQDSYRIGISAQPPDSSLRAAVSLFSSTCTIFTGSPLRNTGIASIASSAMPPRSTSLAKRMISIVER